MKFAPVGQKLVALRAPDRLPWRVAAPLITVISLALWAGLWATGALLLRQ